jgi:hypothetical protein
VVKKYALSLNGLRSKSRFPHGWIAKTILLKLSREEEGEGKEEDWWLLDQGGITNQAIIA